MTKQFDESFKSIIGTVADKLLAIPDMVRKSPKFWAALIAFIVGGSTASNVSTINSELDKKGGYVNKGEVVEAIRDSFIKNNQTVPPDVEEKIKMVMRPKPIIKTKASPVVMLSPKNSTDCDWPAVPIIANAQSADQKMYNYLVSTGRFTPMLAAAIIGNIQVESKFEPKTRQIAKYTKEGPVYGKGRGLVQWEKGGRYDTDKINLLSFAKKRNLSWDSLEAQVMFIVHEFTAHPQYNSLRTMLNNKANTDEAFTLEDCVSAVCKKYEKAGTPHMEKRTEAAQLFIDRNSLNKYVEEKR